MNARHATTVVTRDLAASPERVFRAWAHERGTWDAPGEGWEVAESRHDPRPDGEELTRFGPPGEPRFEARGRYLIVKDNRLLIYADVMHDDSAPMTATLTTIDIAPRGDGARLVLTDQSAFISDENEDQRKTGWGKLVDRLEAYLDGSA